jgi:hypothetical protein
MGEAAAKVAAAARMTERRSILISLGWIDRWQPGAQVKSSGTLLERKRIFRRTEPPLLNRVLVQLMGDGTMAN